MIVDLAALTLRAARPDEGAIIAAHRRAMFAEIRHLPGEQPDYRRRGLARALTETALDWCRQNHVRMVILHASDAGRPIYPALGFTPTNEMSLVLDLDQPRPGPES